jgi:hypothetical protein
LAASLADETRFQIGEPNVTGPLVCADRDRMAAVKVRAIDQEAANASGAHLGEGDFLLAGEGGHTHMIPPI